MKKILAIVLAVVMLLPVFAVNVFAADFFTLTATCDKEALDEDGAALKGWCPAVLVPWKNGDACATFKTALAKEGAVIEVVTDLKINGLTFQASPIDEKGGYPLVTLTEKLGEKTADGKVTTTFSAKAYTDLVANSKYEKDIPDVNFSFDHWNATGINTPDDRDTKLYSFKVILPEDEAEEIVLVENKEFKSWEVLVDGTNADLLKSAMSKEGAIFEASYTTNGNKGWGFQLIFETNSITDTLTVGGEKNVKTISSELIAKQLGSVDNISLFRSNYGVKKVTYHSVKVLKGEKVLVELGERAPSSWGEILTKDELAQVKEALSEEGTSIAFEYTAEGDGWGAQLITETAGKTIGLEKNAVDKTIKMTAAEFADACGGDIKYLARLRNNCDGGSGDTVTYNYIKVTVPASNKKKVSSNLAFIYVTDEYHAVLIGGRFLAMPHTDIGGYCPMCHAIIASEPVDQSVFVLETTGGQDYQDAPGTFADGVVLVDATEGGDNARIATNWIDGGKAWNGIVKAVPTEGAWLKITYTGKLNSIAFQTEKTSAPEAFEITAPAVVEEGEKNVAWFNCADIVANSPVALSGDIGGWANFMLKFEGDTTVYGFEVLVPAEAPVAE